MQKAKLMNAKCIAPLAAALLLSVFSLQPSALLAQGSLTPPGPPGPTMKTLDQIEPRMAITNSGATAITSPGSYYLTRNITVSSGDGVTIATNNVTLDLNGFTIASTASPAVGSGILLSGGRANIAIHSGFVAGSVTNNGSVYSGNGFAYGIYYSGGNPSNVRLSHVTVSGCQNDGINVYLNSSIVEACNVNTIGGTGIFAQSIRDSTVLNCGNTAILGSTVCNCANFSAVNVGINCTEANNCYCYSSNSYGLYATTASNCRGYSVNGTGINAGVANNCFGFSTTNYGVWAFAANNCVGSSSSGTGLYAMQIASGCNGSSSTGVGLSANIANSCYGQSTSSTGLCANIAVSCVGVGSPTLSVTNKYNMP